MRARSLRSLFIAFLLSSPLICHAALNKCTDAKGQVSYSDQPCQVQEGLKPAEVKNATAFAMINAREEHRELGAACARLLEKKRTCAEYVEPKLFNIFETKCEAPMRRRKVDEKYTERWYERRTKQSERVARRERDEYEDDRERPTITCGDVDAVMYQFVKTRFGAELSPEQTRIIEAGHHAIKETSRRQVGENERQVERTRTRK
ncbi:MAG: DUF4124 domain-containing protein [Pseudomonadota bacterium]